MESEPTTNNAKGVPTSIKEQVLHAGASIVQNFAPPKQLCAHLHAYHTYANRPGKPVEANHYCAHVNEDVRQCIIYDGDGPNARLIGIEYLIKPHLYEKLDPEERKLWHSHVYEVKSGTQSLPTSRPESETCRYARSPGANRSAKRCVGGCRDGGNEGSH